jgi:hypothetical protein
MTGVQYEAGEYIYCGVGSDSGSGCPGGTVEQCEECDGLYMDCPCGCSNIDFCECERNEAPGE